MEQHWLAPFIRTGKATDKDHFIKVTEGRKIGLSGHPAFYFLVYLPRDEKKGIK